MKISKPKSANPAKIIIIALIAYVIIRHIFPIVYFVGFIWYDDCFNKNYLNKEEIVELVNDNYELLTKEAENQSFEKSSQIQGITSVYDGDEYIKYACGGRGIGSETDDYGFYLSLDGKEKQVFWDSMKLKPYDKHTSLNRRFEAPLENEAFYYKEEYGDNVYYTEKIKGDFYYYHAHF